MDGQVLSYSKASSVLESGPARGPGQTRSLNSMATTRKEDRDRSLEDWEEAHSVPPVLGQTLSVLGDSGINEGRVS